MPSFNFATITAAQALALTANDTLLIDGGAANNTTILFVPGSGGAADTISMTVGATTVAFSTALQTATKTYADGSRLFVGTTGADAPAAFGAEANGLYGGAGGDTLIAGDGVNQLQGNQGADSLVGGSGYDVIYGGQDNDAINVGASGAGSEKNFGQGNKGDDTVNGGGFDSDTLLGGQGNDLIGAMARGTPLVVGSISIYANPIGRTDGGADFLNGNLGDDVIYGGNGNTTIFGEDGNDQIYTTLTSHAVINGGAGDDIMALAGECTVDGGAGNDAIAGFSGTFVMTLGDGDDATTPVQNGDIESRWTVDGGAGADAITTGDGTDSLNGGAGDDTIDGSGGQDTLAGGDGIDEFQFFAGESFAAQAGVDQIVDWSVNDHLYFQPLNGASTGVGTATNYVENTFTNYLDAQSFADTQVQGGVINYVAVQLGADVIVFADAGNDNGRADVAVRLVGRSLADISAANFVI